MKRTILALAAIFAVLYTLLSAHVHSGTQGVGGKAKNERMEGEKSQKKLEMEAETDGNLILVDQSHPLPADYVPILVTLKNDQSVDERCYPELQKMMDGCRKAGGRPLICSSYRSFQRQGKLYRRKVKRLLSEGYPLEKARQGAATQVAAPGTSEHQTGLAVDIVSIGNQRLDDSQSKTKEQKWLAKNCWKYGFILRYPRGKSDITGIIYELWHYRYVGKKAAKEIHDQGLCLEEYLGNP